MGNMCGGAKGKAEGKPNLIFVVGGPGSGKGTQCERIVGEFKCEHLSTGDLLRAELKTGSELGQRLGEVMSQGGLVQTKDLLVLLENAMRAKGWDKPSCYLIDGFPRNEENVQCFGEVLCPKINLLGVLNFECSAEEMQNRCLGRGQGRADDNEETIKKRLNTFNTETVPTINKLKENGNVYTCNAEQAKDEVTKEAFRCMRGMLASPPLKPDQCKEAPAPVEEPKVEEAPVEEPKVEEAPVEEPKQEEAPVEEPKAEEAPVEEPKAEEAPVEEPKPEEAPAE